MESKSSTAKDKEFLEGDVVHISHSVVGSSFRTDMTGEPRSRIGRNIANVLFGTERGEVQETIHQQNKIYKWRMDGPFVGRPNILKHSRIVKDDSRTISVDSGWFEQIREVIYREPEKIEEMEVIGTETEVTLVGNIFDGLSEYVPAGSEKREKEEERAAQGAKVPDTSDFSIVREVSAKIKTPGGYFSAGKTEQGESNPRAADEGVGESFRSILRKRNPGGDMGLSIDEEMMLQSGVYDSDDGVGQRNRSGRQKRRRRTYDREIKGPLPQRVVLSFLPAFIACIIYVTIGICYVWAQRNHHEEIGRYICFISETGERKPEWFVFLFGFATAGMLWIIMNHIVFRYYYIALTGMRRWERLIWKLIILIVYMLGFNGGLFLAVLAIFSNEYEPVPHGLATGVCFISSVSFNIFNIFYNVRLFIRQPMEYFGNPVFVILFVIRCAMWLISAVSAVVYLSLVAIQDQYTFDYHMETAAAIQYIAIFTMVSYLVTYQWELLQVTLFTNTRPLMANFRAKGANTRTQITATLNVVYKRIEPNSNGPISSLDGTNGGIELEEVRHEVIDVGLDSEKRE